MQSAGHAAVRCWEVWLPLSHDELALRRNLAVDSGNRIHFCLLTRLSLLAEYTATHQRSANYQHWAHVP